MGNFITSTMKLGRKVSMVLWLIDQHSALGCNDELDVYLNGRPAAYQRKAGGYLVFTELMENDFRVRVESRYYLPEEFDVSLSSLNSAEPVVYVPLKPAPAYPFNTGATLIRVSFCSPQGRPLQTVLTAVISSEIAARAQLGRQGAKAGAAEIKLVEVTGRTAPGDLLLIKAREGENEEICELTSMNNGGEGSYFLKQPLAFDHGRGVPVMPLIVTRSDERGEAVIVIRGLRQKEYQVQLQISAGGKQQQLELTVESGKVHQLGKVIVE